MILEGADPFVMGAGNMGGTLKTSIIPSSGGILSSSFPSGTGVSDSIEVDNDNGVTRRASDIPKVLDETSHEMDSNQVWPPM